MSHFFLLQNVPFGNISLHLHTFSSILPVRETFSFMSYIGFTLGLHDFLLKFHALYAGPCHMFARVFYL